MALNLELLEDGMGKKRKVKLAQPQAHHQRETRELSSGTIIKWFGVDKLGDEDGGGGHSRWKLQPIYSEHTTPSLRATVSSWYSALRLLDPSIRQSE